ncbi:MAG: FAD-dependent oxidoreductase [Alphaproteobacteria bacterium]|nr:FAD-dependent oxidoreductase [Alphaproteobacteria bacterium]
MKRVVIVGGGYAGTSLARSLDAVAEVVLVEPRDRFVHNVAAIRALVEPGLLDEIVIPYDRLLKRGQVVHDRAIAIEGASVKLAGGGSIEGDIIVVATGSRYARPFKPEAESVPSFVAASRANHQALVAAKTVAVIGAGAVGTELAGEIAAAFPAKKVTLISAHPTLFHAYPPRLGRKLEAQLKAMRVTLRMGAPARPPKSNDTPFAGRVEMSAGDPITADLVFPVMGARPVNDVLRALPGVTLDSLGRAVVDAWLRPTDAPNLFALGDVAAAGDLMTIVAISRQQPWLTKTIKALIEGKALESLPAYKPWSSPPILIPLGEAAGASVLPFTNKGVVVGSFLTASIKGRQLFVPRYLKEFGYA